MTPTSSFHLRKAAWMLGLAVLVAFGGTLFGGFAWDDLPVIRDNDFLHAFSYASRLFTDDFWAVSDPGAAIRSGYFRPVVKGAWLVLWVVSDGAPWLFHLLNVLLHLASVLLALGWIHRRLVASGSDVSTASVAASLGAVAFALHPSRAESVGWVVGATDLWLGLFVLLAAWAWDRLDGVRGLVVASVFAVLAFLSKESALLLPVVLGVDLAFSGRSGLVVRGWRSLLVVAAALGVVFGARSMVVPLRSVDASSSLAEVVTRVLGSIGYYARALFLPLEPSPLSGETGLDPQGIPLVPMAWVWVGLVVVLVVLGLLLFAFRRDQRAWIADAAWFAVFLSPVLNVTPLGYSMLGSERFLYVPMLGVSAILGRAAVVWLSREVAGNGSIPNRKALLVGLAGGLLWLSLSFAQALRFGDATALWTDARERHPDSPYAADMLARALWTNGDAAAALEHAVFAVRHNVDGPARLRSLSLWYQLLSETIADNDRRALADLQARVETFSTAATTARLPFEPGTDVVVDPAHLKPIVRAPGFRSMRATMAARVGRYARAAALLREWIEEEPSRVSANVNLVQVLIEAGQRDEARRARDEALSRVTDAEGRSRLLAIEIGSAP